jgi:hypothetical protein
LYLDSRFGQSLGAGTLFWLQDPKVLRSPRYAFTLSAPFVAVTLAHYVITEANRTLDIAYTTSSSIIELPLENHSIDELVNVLIRRLLFGLKVAYSGNINTLRFSSEGIHAALAIGHTTTCGGLLGVRAGDTSVLGSYKAPGGVNLAVTTSFYLRSNLRTRNRDPRTLGYSPIIANAPITKPHNGLERFSQSGFTFGIRERLIHYIAIEIFDDALEPATFHGGKCQVRIEFAVE